MAAIILGIIGAFFALLGLIPFMGICNWISIPLLVIGLILGIVGICTKPKEKRGVQIAGTVICGVFLIVAGWRTWYGFHLTKKTAGSLVNPSTLEKLENTSENLKDLSDSLNKLNDSINQ